MGHVPLKWVVPAIRALCPTAPLNPGGNGIRAVMVLVFVVPITSWRLTPPGRATANNVGAIVGPAMPLFHQLAPVHFFITIPLAPNSILFASAKDQGGASLPLVSINIPALRAVPAPFQV